ncbi:MAG: membrane protein insertase YidC [Deltaproteobacteria bacterium]|nr:membrane protein insertase YidC [Deltaproteobacteria bacterium]
MNQEQRALLAAGISFVIFIAWYHFYGSRLPSSGQVSQPPPPIVSTSEPPAVLEQAATQVTPHLLPEEKTTFRNGKVTWELTSHGGQLHKIILHDYHEGIHKESRPINLILSEQDQVLTLVCDQCNFALPQESSYQVISKTDQEIIYEGQNNDLLVRKKFIFPSSDNYPFELEISLENRSTTGLTGAIGLVWKAAQKKEPPKGFLQSLKGPADLRDFLYQIGNQTKRANYKKGETSSIAGSVTWAEIKDRYFVMALVNRRVTSETSLKMMSGEGETSLILSPGKFGLSIGGRHEEKFTIYAGPKDRGHLQKIGVGLEKSIDYGYFSFLAVPLFWLLIFFQKLIHNWGFAIILLTIFIKILLNPLSVKSFRQMKEMQKIQPRLQELKEKYKEDRQRLNTETMQLFKSHKVNPMGGCLPMLLQIPIYIALWKVIYNSIELYNAPFFWFYRNLSAPDPYFILPILSGVVTILQQKLTPSTTTDPVQKQMMMIMPLMFTAFMLFLPLGLVLYFFVNTVMSVAQQYSYQKDIRLRDLLRPRKRT